MNVLIAALSAPAHLNGVSRHAINLARALLGASEVSRVHFLAGDWQKPMFSGALAEADRRLHPHWIRLPDANFSRLFWYYRELPQIARQLEADVVHLTYPAPLGERSHHCPFVVSLHDLYPFDTPVNFGTLRSALARRIMEQCIRRADAIACVSGGTLHQLGRWFPDCAAQAVVIPNVVELKASSAERALEPIRGHSFLLSVAQHRRNKNVPLAISVFARAVGERILPGNAHFVVVGISGPDTPAIHNRIRDCRLEGRVHLYSGLSEPELLWCYRNCAALLAPSTIEGFGLPVAEAALAGCRIVCSDIPAFQQVGGSLCRFVSHNDDPVAAYTHALADSLAAPKPPARTLPHFSATVIGRRYAELYSALHCSRIPEFDMLAEPESAR